MASEMPFINAVLARLSDVERTIAAFGIVAVISITIESPVISLLSTSTALARSSQSYNMLKRFTLHLIYLTTILHILIGWTPLFDLVVDNLMGIPESLHEQIRLGMKLMIFWSGSIAWRRFKQGVLIRHGYTRFVGQGTFVRLVSSAGFAYALGIVFNLPGIIVATISLEAGVIAEATYAHWVARKIINEKFGAAPENNQDNEISYMELVNFHWPLAATNLLFLLTRPLIAAALSRGFTPERDLAAWPITQGVLFLTRAVTLALPEVVIALHDREDSKQLSRFSITVGLICSAVLAVVSFTPLSRFYFETIIGVSSELADLAVIGARVAILLPLLMSGVSFYRGHLTAQKITKPVSLGMIAEISTLALVLTAGLHFQIPGITLAALAIVIATSADALILFITARKQINL